MRANFEDAYRDLAPAAARLFRLLGLHPADDIGLAAAAALADVPEPEARELLEALTARELAAASGEGRFTLPGPLRGYARELAEREETAAERDAALRRALDHYLAATATGGRDATAGEGELEAGGLALLERERWAEAAETLQDGLRRAEAGGDPHAILMARHNLARALAMTGDLDRAIDLLGPLPDEFAALPEPDDYNRARALASLGEAYLRARRPVAATNFFGQALEIMRRQGAVDQQAAMFVHIADAARQRGDHAAEAAALDRAVELYDSIESPKSAAVARRRAALE
ncbi:tetratricopeptide repeat protein [Actinomadura sp. KC216]|uniref:tetratricopeptide repeat protein n=1 Tax=Actinomadura sp. KC216 TaxID=2530370 RepID=UPI001044EB27|nr:tetratricopeptide repeat protein [Actinomadura sp. KC216]TDB88566.1 tetratricopeptide repeat protein [Actinomadura sp. KC216]